jgi:hypothetical protein
MIGIYLSSKIPNFVDMKSLDTPNRKLSVVCDVRYVFILNRLFAPVWV